MPLVQFIVAIGVALIIAFATSETMRNEITPGDFVSYIFAMIMLLVPMRALSSITAKIQKGIAAGESVNEFLSLESEIDRGGEKIKSTQGSIIFNDVSFKYDINPHIPVLNSVTFEVKPNQTVAIVGRSGSGKSTLVNLLPRLYEIQQGQILIDGIDVKSLSLQNLRSHIAYVGQDVRLFNDSVRNNIAYGEMADKSDAEIIQAVETVPCLGVYRKNGSGP